MRLQREIDRLSAQITRLKDAAEAWDVVGDPVALMQRAGIDPDPWQRRVLLPAGAAPAGAKRTLQLVTRQGGKSTTTAGKALHKALTMPGSLTLLLSPSLRQSQELFAKVTGLYLAAGEPVGAERLSALQMELTHGSRIIALPGTEKTVRGFSGVDLLVIDEAARVLDELYYAVRPMLAVSGGELVAMTTPWGKRGWFYEEWTGSEAWERIMITAHECPRITPEFLDEERRTLPDAWFRSEYLCEFTDTVDSVFRIEDIEAMLSDDVEPLFGAGSPGAGPPAGDGAPPVPGHPALTETVEPLEASLWLS